MRSNTTLWNRLQRIEYKTTVNVLLHFCFGKDTILLITFSLTVMIFDPSLIRKIITFGTMDGLWIDPEWKLSSTLIMSAWVRYNTEYSGCQPLLMKTPLKSWSYYLCFNKDSKLNPRSADSNLFSALIKWREKKLHWCTLTVKFRADNSATGTVAHMLQPNHASVAVLCCHLFKLKWATPYNGSSLSLGRK